MAENNKKKPLPPVDTNVKIPASVILAAAKAKEIHEANYTQPEPEPAPPVEAAAPAEPAPPAPPVEVAPAPPPPAPAPAPPQVDEQSWEHRYNSMKGRFERAETINRTLSERMEGMEATIAAMSIATPAAAAPPIKPTSLVTPEEVTDYGDAFLDVVGRKAKEAFSPEVEALKQQVEELNKRLGNVGAHVQQDARSRMHAYLDQKLPNWKLVNDNEKFLDWLALPDTYSNAIRHQLLKSAYAANDAPRVANFFNGFLAEEAAVSPREPAPDLVPEVHTSVPKVPLESLAAPGRAKSAAAQAPAEKPFFTRAQITKFYADIARGMYRGRDEDKNRLEAQIHQAGREGRIQ